MTDTANWISALRRSQDRFASLVTPLNDAQLQTQSYDDEWSIAQVASHLGSQAEIFELFLASGLDGTPAPGAEAFAPIWDRWNGLPPTEQAGQSVAANEAFVARIEQLSSAEREQFALSMFGREFDLSGFAAMRLGEHVVHSWDIAVALDPSATLPTDVVDLLLDTIHQHAARSGKPVPDADPIAVDTTDPERHFQLTLSPEVGLSDQADGADDPLDLPAEALIRLVYGRLDPDHTPAGANDDRLDQLRSVFPGF